MQFGLDGRADSRDPEELVRNARPPGLSLGGSATENGRNCDRSSDLDPYIQQGKFNIGVVLLGVAVDGGWSQAQAEGAKSMMMDILPLTLRSWKM